MCKLRFRDFFFLTAIAAHLPARLSECVSQDISNIIYTYGVLGVHKPQFFAVVRDFVNQNLMGRVGSRDREFLISAFRTAGVPLESSDDCMPILNRPPVVKPAAWSSLSVDMEGIESPGLPEAMNRSHTNSSPDNSVIKSSQFSCYPSRSTSARTTSGHVSPEGFQRFG